MKPTTSVLADSRHFELILPHRVARTFRRRSVSFDFADAFEHNQTGSPPAASPVPGPLRHPAQPACARFKTPCQQLARRAMKAPTTTIEGT